MSQMKNKKQNLKIDIAVIRSPRTNMRSSKHLTLKSKKSLLTTSTTLASKNSEVNEIDEIIKNSNFRKKLYSKSLVNPYIPLTKFDKVKEITEMDEKSSNRLKKYSSIFEQIKKEIYDINNMNISNKTKNIEGFICRDGILFGCSNKLYMYLKIDGSGNIILGSYDLSHSKERTVNLSTNLTGWVDSPQS